jgi:rubredoxin
MKAYLCKCNNCENVFIDENPQVGVPLHKVEIGQFGSLLFDGMELAWVCPVCKTDGYLADM